MDLFFLLLDLDNEDTLFLDDEGTLINLNCLVKDWWGHSCLKNKRSDVSWTVLKEIHNLS